jgi:hypothetical protein
VVEAEAEAEAEVARPLPASRLEASDAAVGVAVVAAAARVALPPPLTAPQDAAAEMPVSPLHLTVHWAKCRSVHWRCRPDAGVGEEVAAA